MSLNQKWTPPTVDELSGWIGETLAEIKSLEADVAQAAAQGRLALGAKNVAPENAVETVIEAVNMVIETATARITDLQHEAAVYRAVRAALKRVEKAT
ncbi:MAG TPA: hypothetical protein VM487_18075 [Phycisphaerae bacterium]|nr:hypothetical protein [Phycisphaerae bacterium]